MSGSDLLLLRASRLSPLPALQIRGQYFEQATGDRFLAIEAIDFSLYGRYLNGEDIIPILTQRHNCGFTMLRVGTRATNWFGCVSLAAHPEFYDRVPDFVDLCAAFGLYVDWIVYIGKDQDYDAEHWDLMGLAVKRATSPSSLLSLVIEASNQQGANQIDLSQFFKLPGILCSRGSNGSSFTGTVYPPLPPMDWLELHWNIASEWQRKCGHDSSPVARHFDQPVFVTETIDPAKGESSNYGPEFNTRDAQIARYKGAGEVMALEIAGGTFNCNEGKWSTLFADSLDYATAFCSGMRSIDLKVQDGQASIHRPDLDEASGQPWLRVYQKQDQFAEIPK